ncbi:MAG: hypothetical protein ABI175_09720 [Polyangiales bacterium]
MSMLACVTALGGAAALSGCDDPRSVDWQVKHLSDSNPMDRSKAIEGISQQWRATDQSGKDADKKAFKDKAIAELAKAYTSDSLKDSGKDRKKIMDILSQAEDPRAKPAFLHAIKNYKPGETEDEVKASVRSIMKMKTDPAFAGDAETGKAMLAGLANVKWATSKSGEIGALVGDAISGLKITDAKGPLLDIVKKPNDGSDNPATKEVTAYQIVAAQILGEIGDGSIVPDLIDVMYTDAATMAKRKDATTGDEVEQASPLTTGVSMVIGSSLAKIGEPAIAPLMPYVKDDKADPKVLAVKEKFKKYISPGGSGKPTAYIDIATTTIANIGLPKVAAEVAAIVKDKNTKDGDRKPLIGLLVSLPPDPVVVDAIQQGYAVSTTSKLKTDIAASAMRTMEPEMIDWLLGIARDKKSDDDLKMAALGSAQWLAPKDKIDDVTGLYDKKTLDKKDNTWRAMEPTAEVCDPTKLTGEKKDRCAEEAEPADAAKPKFVMWNDVTPTYKEEMGILADVLKCDKDAKCYFDAFKAAVAEVDKQGLTKVTQAGTRAGIRMQKAIWMLAAFGSEDDMVALVNYMPSISTPAGRSFVQMALDKNHNSAAKVSDAIANLVKTMREKGDENANREAAQLEPIANKLRARAKSAKPQ